MSRTMNQKKLQALAEELAKDLKTPEDLSALSAQLTKITVEAALKAEMNNPIKMTQTAITAAIAAMVIRQKRSKEIMVKSNFKRLGIVMAVLNHS
jgi:transposase-like protein